MVLVGACTSAIGPADGETDATLDVNFADHQPTDVTNDRALFDGSVTSDAAGVGRILFSQIAPSARRPPAGPAFFASASFRPRGAIIWDFATGPCAMFRFGNPQRVGLDGGAGAATLRVQDQAFPMELVGLGGYQLNVPQDAIPGDRLTFSFEGDIVPAFTTSVVFQPSIQVLEPEVDLDASARLPVALTSPWSVRWSGMPRYVEVVFGVGFSAVDFDFGYLTCRFPGTLGVGTVPVEALATLSGSIAGQLSISAVDVTEMRVGGWDIETYARHVALTVGMQF